LTVLSFLIARHNLLTAMVNSEFFIHLAALSMGIIDPK